MGCARSASFGSDEGLRARAGLVEGVLAVLVWYGRSAFERVEVIVEAASLICTLLRGKRRAAWPAPQHATLEPLLLGTLHEDGFVTNRVHADGGRLVFWLVTAGFHKDLL